MARYHYGGWAPYVSVGERRRRAAREVAKLRARGRRVDPVEIEGRKIAKTFWGRAWCENLERYSDFANRLPRGRTYVRNGSVLDLQIGAGRVKARVNGSTSSYRVEVRVKRLAPKRWKAVRRACTGSIDSLVELLEGRLSDSVMEVVTSADRGLFPSPRAIELSCSCPDWADMCKHVAATLYGVGARLDRDPELLFTLRGVDPADLIASSTSGPAPARGAVRADRLLETDDLSALFGIELDGASGPPAPRASTKRARKKAGRKAPASAAPPAARRTRKSSAKKDTPRARRSARRIRAKELTAQGIPHSAIQGWLRSGVLVRTNQRGVYRNVSLSKAKIRAYVASRGPVAAKELTAQGIPHSTIQGWLRTGVLVRTNQRGLYRRTPATQPRIEAYLAKRHRRET